MKRLAWIAALTFFLAGCASTIRSNVTSFQQWPADLKDKSYVFEAPPAADDTLEYRSYQNLVRAELGSLGFVDAGATGTPALKVSMRFRTEQQPVRVIEVQDPFFYAPPRLGMHYWRNPYWGWGHGPFYDPFWRGPVPYSDEIVDVYRRELQVAIRSHADGKRLFDVTVRNQSGKESTPAVMPALVHSAFVDFPGPNGAARTVVLKLQ
jgi:hypothetical protein